MSEAPLAWRLWAGFIAMALGMFMVILDIQIVASSLIDIQADLAIPADRLSYLQTSYLIAEVIAIALSGWLTRALSTRGLFAAAMIGFVAASAACAASQGYIALYVARFVQGFFGGLVIPLVFSAAFAMFPPRSQGVATALGGGLAMLAPTFGPLAGGWITEHLSWHWLFLVNIVPGLAAAAIVFAWVRIDRPQWRKLADVDGMAVGFAALFLSCLELGLKEGPHLGWLSPWPLTFAAASLLSGRLLVWRCLHARQPLVDLRAFDDRIFAAGACLSFVLGMALYGAVYLLPLFLGLVRDHGPLETGEIMMVTGAAQLVAAPVVAMLGRRIAPGPLILCGYFLLGGGLAWNAFATPDWDFAALTGPQLLRGAAFMLALLPVTHAALGHLPAAKLADASALFNLLRNLGGAVGLALIDTVIETRPARHAADIIARLQAGDRATAAFVGLPLERFHGTPLPPIDDATRELVRPLVERAALVESFNDAWIMLAVVILVSLALLPFMRGAGALRSPP